MVSPYHLRLDLLVWFLPKSDPWMHPWVFALVEKLLAGDRQVLALLAHNPFAEEPPRFLRARLFHYASRRTAIARAPGCAKSSACTCRRSSATRSAGSPVAEEMPEQGGERPPAFEW